MLKRVLVLVAILFTGPAQAEDPWLSIPEAPAMPKAVESGHVKVNGIDMYYATYGSGSGTPILMIHGGLAHGDIWAAQVADLQKDYRIIIADTRGHGRSTHDGSDYSYDVLAKDYLALLDHLNVQSVHLVGWSDGANIGFAISTSAPDRLASHFAHAGNVTLDGIDPTVEKNAVFGAYVGMMAKDYAAMSSTPDGFNDFLAGVSKMWGTEKPGGFESLQSVTVPTLVVQSEHDEAIKMEHAVKISETVPGAKLQVMKDVSHFASFQAPDAYTAAIRAFLP